MSIDYYSMNLFQVLEHCGWRSALYYLQNEFHGAQFWWCVDKQRSNTKLSRFWLWCYIILMEFYDLLRIMELRSAWCEVYGHKWHVEASIGPDSGSEDFECVRCGEYHNIIYY